MTCFFDKLRCKNHFKTLLRMIAYVSYSINSHRQQVKLQTAITIKFIMTCSSVCEAHVHRQVMVKE